jgi:hypothetical protein
MATEYLENADPFTVVYAPSFAGGRLSLFNCLLRCSAAAISASEVTPGARPQVCLILDDNLTAARDLKLPVQNAHGDVVHMEIPDHGKLSVGSRLAFRHALLDTLPETAQVQAAVDFVLPQALQTPLEAASALWSTLFPSLQIETIVRGAPSRLEGPQKHRPASGITWFTARHLLAMQELGLSTEMILQGESACKNSLPPIPAGRLGKQIKHFLAENEQHLALLKPLAAEVDPKLIGSWARLRRDWRASILEFSERADRAGDNRVGIRNARLHTLAQGIRPHDASQERGLSFLTAIASFQLGYPDFSPHITTLMGCMHQESVQLYT